MIHAFNAAVALLTVVNVQMRHLIYGTHITEGHILQVEALSNVDTFFVIIADSERVGKDNTRIGCGSEQ